MKAFSLFIVVLSFGLFALANDEIVQNDECNKEDPECFYEPAPSDAQIKAAQDPNNPYVVSMEAQAHISGTSISPDPHKECKDGTCPPAVATGDAMSPTDLILPGGSDNNGTTYTEQ